RVLSKIVSLHFTRIHAPERDGMGSHVRLRVFVASTSLVGVKGEIDKRLTAQRKLKKVAKVKRRVVNWEKIAADYGGKELAELFRDYLDANSVVVCGLLCKKAQGVKIDEQLWPWAHFFFNGVRGYGSKVVDFGPHSDIKLMGNL
ncbi:MAG: hypothetical protein QGD94_06925, partial [Planctomycetia bacterium]|nr:hypothetical protein [Planctomycetia bacterium]